MATTRKKSTKKAEPIEANVINLGQTKDPIWYPIDWEKVRL